MRRAIVMVALAGCGSPTKPVLSNRAAPQVEQASCADVGVVLRAHVLDEDRAGPDKEATIAKACASDTWPREVITCVASSTHPRECLDRLPADTLAAYTDKLQAWATKWGEELDHETSAIAVPDPIACSGVGDAVVAIMPPTSASTGDAHELALTMRRRELAEQCDRGWTEDAKHCLLAGATTAFASACLVNLDQVQRKTLDDGLRAIDELATKTVATLPKAPDCKKLVAGHYADAAWKGTLATVTGKARSQVVAASRQAMLAACASDAWTDVTRACLAIGGGHYCSQGAFRWGFPARGVDIPTGIAECDAYIHTMRRYATCERLPATVRDTLGDSLDASQRAIVEMTANPAKRPDLVDSCRDGADSAKRSLGVTGC